jgi:hypothetical protein
MSASTGLAWFRRNWSTINVVYLIVISIAFWIVNGRLTGDVTPAFIPAIGVLLISLSFECINTGETGDVFTLQRIQNPIGFWVVVLMTLTVGCVFLFGGVGNLWRSE